MLILVILHLSYDKNLNLYNCTLMPLGLHLTGIHYLYFFNFSGAITKGLAGGTELVPSNKNKNIKIIGQCRCKASIYIIQNGSLCFFTKIKFSWKKTLTPKKCTFKFGNMELSWWCNVTFSSDLKCFTVLEHCTLNQNIKVLALSTSLIPIFLR